MILQFFDQWGFENSCQMVGFPTKEWDMDRGKQLIGQSLAFLDASERASRAAPLNRPVLVIGERGTGKELIAEKLHHLSTRWSAPLVTTDEGPVGLCLVGAPWADEALLDLVEVAQAASGLD